MTKHTATHKIGIEKYLIAFIATLSHGNNLYIIGLQYIKIKGECIA